MSCSVTITAYVKKLSLLEKALGSLKLDLNVIKEENDVVTEAQIIDKAKNCVVSHVTLEPNNTYKLEKYLDTDMEETLNENYYQEQVDQIKQLYSYNEVLNLIKAENYSLVNKTVKDDQIVLKLEI